MHSSRMRTARLLTVSRSARGSTQGVVCPEGMSAQGRCLPGGVCSGECLLGGCLLRPDQRLAQTLAQTQPELQPEPSPIPSTNPAQALA